MVLSSTYNVKNLIKALEKAIELDLYVAKLLIIVWIVLPYLALKHVMALKPSDNSWLGYIFLYLLYLILLPVALVVMLLVLVAIYQAIYPIFNILFLTW